MQRIPSNIQLSSELTKPKANQLINQSIYQSINQTLRWSVTVDPYYLLELGDEHLIKPSPLRYQIAVPETLIMSLMSQNRFTV